MIKAIQRHVPPPAFEDAEKTRVGKLLNNILFICGILILLLMPVNALQPNAAARVIPNVVMFGVLVGLYFLARGGRLALAAVALPAFLWVVLTIVMFLFGGVTSPTFNLYVVVILMAGLLVSTRAAVVFLILTGLAGLGALYADQHGFLPPSLERPDPTIPTLLTIVSNLAIIVYLVHLSNQSLKQAVQRARSNERDLSSAIKQLSSSEARWRGVVDNAPLTIVLASTEGRINFVNSNSMAAEQVKGHSVFDFADDDQRTAAVAARERVLATRRPATYESPGTDLRGKPGWYEVFLGPILVEDTVQELVYIINDITDRKAAEEAIIRANAELQRHRDRLEELVEARTAELEAANRELVAISRVKDEFVSNVSHELTTPITNSLLHLRLAQLSPREAASHLAIVERETRRLGLIIEDLLQLSRLDQDVVDIKREDLDINALVAEIHADRQALARTRGVTLELDTTGDLPPVSGDGGLLRQTLSILLTNALNYTPGGGQVRIHTGSKQVGSEAWVGFSVEDTGPGILQAERRDIFKRFSRGRAGHLTRHPGTGLGLAIAHEIVTRHGGVIELESSGVEGEGTQFHVWLRPAANSYHTQKAPTTRKG